MTENLTADANGVYHITSAADLVAMMNDSKYPNCNTYQNVVLECDIYLGGKEVSGFGDDSGFFDGIFDGKNYTISNMTINETAQKTDGYVCTGFFGIFFNITHGGIFRKRTNGTGTEHVTLTKQLFGHIYFFIRG